MTARIMGAMLVALLAAPTGCEKAGSPGPSTTGPAGRVLEVRGAVSVERDGRTQPVTPGVEVLATDVVITGEDGAVTIVLFHNQARWSLDAGQRKQIDQSVAWRAPKQAGADLLASGAEDDDTAAAGRHAEKEAADTAATALMPGGAAPADEESAAAPQPAAAATSAPAPARPAAQPAPAPAKQAPRAPAQRAPAPKQAPPPPAPPPPPADSPVASGGGGGGTIGLGNVGTIGKGGGGSTGSGYGRGTGARSDRKKSPQLRLGSAAVAGSLDKNIIRRVVRRHIGALRGCYERELSKKPDLAGSVTLDFTIAADGTVAAATTTGALADALGACLAARVETMTFPSPKGGIVRVKYPLAFKPE